MIYKSLRNNLSYKFFENIEEGQTCPMLEIGRAGRIFFFFTSTNLSGTKFKRDQFRIFFFYVKFGMVMKKLNI